MSKNDIYPERIPGIWWFSDDPDNTMPGDLIVNDRKLELNGSFEGVKPGVIGAGKSGIVCARQDKTILGIARNGGKKYTLEYFDEPSFTMAMPGYKADTYHLGRVFEGDHFFRTNDLAFEKYFSELPYLLEWVNDGVISVQMTVPDKACIAAQTSFKIEIGGTKTVEVFAGPRFNISFLIYPEGVSLATPIRDMCLSQRCVVKIESVGDNLSLTQAGVIMAHFERFLAIATGRNINPINLEASSGCGREIKKVKIITPERPRTHRSDISVHEMNFSFSDIKSDSQNILGKWLEDMDKHTDMFDVFSIIHSDTPKNLNNYFKDVVSAIEGYVSIEDNKLDVGSGKAVKTLNEKLLREHRLFKSADYDKIRITRNKLSHLTIKQKDEVHVLSDSDKWTSAQRMVFLLEYSLLKGLRLSDAMMAQIYNRRKHRL